MSYKVFYRGEDAGYPVGATEAEALEFYCEEVKKATGESREEILSEEWASPRGVERCVQVRAVGGTPKEVYDAKTEEYAISAREYFDYLRRAMMPSVQVIRNATPSDYITAIEMLEREKGGGKK